MKIVSLLPAATEIVYALGLGGDLEAVTDECDHPAEAATKPVVSRAALAQGPPLSSREIDAAVRERTDQKEPLYVLDKPLIQRIQPDVILTQDLCRVCAVPSGLVEDALAELGVAAEVISLDPHSLEDVLGSILEVGRRLEAEDRAEDVVAGMRERIDGIRRTGLRLPTIRAFCLEWSAPPFVAGHWIPEMVEAAGGTNLLNDKGRPSRVVSWRGIRDAGPEVVVFMPCGYYLEEAEHEGLALYENPEFAETPAAREGNVIAVDAASYFSRPGPRLVDGLEILAWAIHPDAHPEPADGTVARLARP